MCYLKKNRGFFVTWQVLSGRPRRVRTSKEEMIGNQREEALWLEDRVRKKKKSAKSIPLRRFFFIQT
jgi:hypothetical protein